MPKPRQAGFTTSFSMLPVKMIVYARDGGRREGDRMKRVAARRGSVCLLLCRAQAVGARCRGVSGGIESSEVCW